MACGWATNRVHGLLTVWIHDDPARTPTNRTEVVFSKYDSTTELWSGPVAVADDGTADFHPQIVALSNGDALLAWENAGEVLIEPDEPGDPCVAECEGDPDYAQCLSECKYEELKSKTEIAVAYFDDLAQPWSAQTILTNNTMLDRSPRISVASDGTALLTWVSNAANEEMGSTLSPNANHYATFDGVGWSAPADVALDVSSVVKSALAYDGNAAVLLLTGDTDGDDQTPEDRELFAVSYDGATWGAVTQLTDDAAEPLEGANPQVAYPPSADCDVRQPGCGRCAPGQ